MTSNGRKKFVFGLASPAARQEQLLLSEYLSDVVFRVGGGTGQLFHAHKLILTVASEVFYAQFNGYLAEAKQDSRKNPIVIEDITPKTFKQILRYIYCRNIDLTVDNVIDVYGASQKYMLTGLNRVCEAFLKKTLDEENVMKMFDANRRYAFRYIDTWCLDIIRENPIKCFRSKDFLTLSQPALKLIAACRTMNCQQKQLCEAIQKWSIANESKAYIKTQCMNLQCRKLFGFGTFRYAQHVSTVITIKTSKKMFIYGVGVFVGVQSSTLPTKIELTVKIDPTINVSKMVRTKQDLHIEEICFERCTVTKECRIVVTNTNATPENQFCLSEFKPVDTVAGVEIFATGIPPADGSTNCVAYLLYNLDLSRSQ